MRAQIQAGVDAANAGPPRVKRIEKLVIVRGDWLPGGDEPTPTMKLERRPIPDKYTAGIARCTATDPFRVD
jgi:long-subunit acyl-CoA synthetase (AMP-forming)